MARAHVIEYIKVLPLEIRPKKSTHKKNIKEYKNIKDKTKIVSRANRRATIYGIAFQREPIVL